MYAGNNNQEKWLLDFCQVIARFSFLLIASISSTILHEQQVMAQKTTTSHPFLLLNQHHYQQRAIS